MGREILTATVVATLLAATAPAIAAPPALVLGGTDADMFDPALPQPGSRVTFDLAGTSLSIPVSPRV